MQYIKQVATHTLGSNTTSAILTLGGGISVPVGNTLCLVAGGAGTISRSVSSIVDSKGNTYELSLNSAGNTTPLCLAKAYITNALAPGDTITVTWSGTMATSMVSVHEFSGVTNVTVDKTATATATNTSPASAATATTTQADELLWGAVQVTWGVTTAVDDFTAAAGIELPTLLVATGSNQRALHPVYRIVSATGAYTTSGTLVTSNQWRASIATYKGTLTVATPRSQAVIIG
jgi:hypothetical protein